jgi:hypothetical protein
MLNSKNNELSNVKNFYGYTPLEIAEGSINKEVKTISEFINTKNEDSNSESENSNSEKENFIFKDNIKSLKNNIFNSVCLIEK